MSEQDEFGQIFAFFPGQRNGKLLIDITKIEAIEQSEDPRAATIYTHARPYYVFVEDPLGQDQTDAMGYITMQIALVSEAAEQAQRGTDGESDNEDNFNPNDFVDLPRPSRHVTGLVPDEHDCEWSGCND